MDKIRNRIAKIHTELLNIIGDCLQYDLSGDQISKIQDKKQEIITKLFELQVIIKRYTDETID